MLSAVGSLEDPRIRFAGAQQAVSLAGRLEIVARSSTLSGAGAHLHVALPAAEEQMVDRHVMNGCRVYTTAEIVVAELPAVAFALRCANRLSGVEHRQTVAIGEAALKPRSA